MKPVRRRTDGGEAERGGNAEEGGYLSKIKMRTEEAERELTECALHCFVSFREKVSFRDNDSFNVRRVNLQESFPVERVAAIRIHCKKFQTRFWSNISDPSA